MSCPAHALAASRRMLVKEDVDLIRELVEVGLERIREPLGDKDVVPCLNVCDLGAGSGTTALAVFAAAKPGAVRVTTIDWDAEALGWAGLAVSNIDRKGDWKGLTAEARGTPIDEVDLLLVDVEHSYDGTRGVVETWLPKMKEGGIIWIHDYGNPADFGLPSEPTPGVRRAVDELVESGQLAKLATRGLGWAGAKPSTSEVTDVSPEQFETKEDPAYVEHERNDEPASPDEATTTAGRSEPEPEADSDCNWPGCGWNVPEGKDFEKSLRAHKRVKKHQS